MRLAALRQSLRSSVSVSMAPYGYTLTVWGSGALAIEALGRPSVLDALLLMAGAVLAFLALEGFAYGTVSPRMTAGPAATVTLWGSAHWLSAGSAIAAAWLVTRGVHGPAGWLLAGLVPTIAYLLLDASQVTLARVLIGERSPAGERR